MNLSENQKKVVSHIDGALLVKAGPGSGKTRVLIERIKQLLSIKKRGKILALTFSNMAAEEMRERLENDSQVGDAIERVTVNTMHSFCLDLIQSRGHLIGLRPDIALFENDTDRAAILREVIRNNPDYAVFLTGEPKPAVVINKLLAAISEQKRNLILPEHSEEIEPFPSLYHDYNEALSSQNAMDFDDILFFAYRILVENPNVAELYTSVYKYACIDESQDLNEAQYLVLRALCGDTFQNIMMVGDENQSIYAFNGSSSKYMADEFVKDFSPTVYELNENFRSSKEVIKFANSLKGVTVDVSNYYYDGEVTISSFENEPEESQFVVRKIQELIQSGHKDIESSVTFDKIAIIARNKYLFANLEEELTQSEIPFYIKQTQAGIVTETDDLKIFDLALKLTLNPLDNFHLQILHKLVTGKSSSSSNSKISVESLLAETSYSWLQSSIAKLPNEGLVKFDTILTELENSIPSTLNDDHQYLIKKDIQEWKSHWNRFKSRVASEYRTLVSFRNAIALGKTQDLSSDSGVTLLTAHMSKGLEYEVVFVVGLGEGTFPDYRAVASGGEALEQEKNNMYVAVTRAKRLCYLSYPQIKQMPWGDLKRQSPSRFISNHAVR